MQKHPYQSCRCNVRTDCPDEEACAPWTDNKGSPVGPYVCKPNNGSAYAGCYGLLTNCGNGYCCLADAIGNQFCAFACQTSSECGNAKCIEYPDTSNTTCSSGLGCGP